VSGDAVDAIRHAAHGHDAVDASNDLIPDSASDVDVDRSALRDRDAGRSFRRRVPIMAYTGANGSGKSLAMVHDTVPSIGTDRVILSTVKILDPSTGELAPNYVRFHDWIQLIDLKHADVLMDEVQGIASSRSSGSMPQAVLNLLMQMRRNDCVLRWTAPDWKRADTVLREVTRGVTTCKGFLSVRPKNPDGTPSDRVWRESRAFRWRTFDATNFEEWSMNKGDKLGADQSSWFWRPGSAAMHAYDTLDAVSRVGEILDGGRCLHCGGSRVVPKCRCSTDEHVH
jgi:hypothetical protein